MKFCEIQGCRGHLAKHPDCVTEALDVTSEWSDESTGDTDGFGVFVALHMIEAPCDFKGEAYDMPDFTIPAGTFCLVITNSQGGVTRLDYETAQAAQDAFDLYEHQYSLWCEAEERREAEIMIGSGRIGR